MVEFDAHQTAARGVGAQAKAVRMLRMAWLLQQGDCSVPELMRCFGVSRRTVYRDLRVIYSAGLPPVPAAAKTQRFPGNSAKLPAWAEPPH